VQACGDVLPRLYLLITAGATYIESRQAPAKDILNDLVEMTKGVQHPMRGLFLRNYLAQACKDKLPDTGSKFEGRAGGDVSHAVDFILRNFSETNRLWVRMQNQGPTKEKKRREKERQDLRILVGTNLVRLSQLEGVDVERYKTAVLPRLLEQVVNCKDAIAQPYLLDCIIQVFPDEFHLATLDAFLAVCTQLKEKVNVRLILESMMKRLASGARDATEAGSEDDYKTPPHAFEAFNACANKLLENQGDKGKSVDLAELLRLQAALLDFAVECYPGRLDYVNHCFATCAAVLRANDQKKSGMSSHSGSSEGGKGEQQQRATLDEDEAEQLERVLALPLAPAVAPTVGLRGVLELSLFADLVDYLPWRRRKYVSLCVVKAVLGAGESLDSVDKVEKLFSMIAPLVKDQQEEQKNVRESADASSKSSAESKAEDEAEQLLVAKLTHLFKHSDVDTQFKILGAARRHLGQGGLGRVRYTLVPLVFRALDLARKIRAVERTVAAQQAKKAAATKKKTIATKKDVEGDEGEPKKEEDAAAEEAEEEGSTNGTKKKAEEEDDEEAAAEEEEVVSPPQYSSRKVFQFVHEIVTAMAGSFPSLSLNLFLQCAQEADRSGFKAIAYEFVSQAFIIYEDELPDSKAQLKALHLMVGCLLLSANFDETDYDALVTKTTQYAAKLLKKPDQCRMVATCSHLFWPFVTSADGTAPATKAQGGSGYRDARRVLECLQRSLKIADASMNNASAPYGLFVEILDHYLVHYEKKTPTITPKYIAGLVALINEHVENMDAGDARTALQAHYHNTLNRIKSQNIIDN